MTDVDIRRLPGAATIEDAHAVRRAVFIEGQGVSEAEEMDGRDDDAVHVVAYATDSGEPIGTARLRAPGDDVAKIERVAVREAHRGEGIGARLMERIEAEARRQGCSVAALHAQVAVEAFYDRIGYETTGGEFEEAGIPHVEMKKRL